MNRIEIIGRLTRDAELKSSTSGVSYYRNGIAVDRRGKDAGTDFFNILGFGKTAEFLEKYFRKGSAICVCGRIQNRTWVDQNGQKRYMTDIIAEEANFVESRNAQDGQSGYGAPDTYSAPAYSSPAQTGAPKFEEIKTDDDLPF